MVNKRKEEIDWCCEELKSMTDVRSRGVSGWAPHIAVIEGDDAPKLVRVTHQPNNISAFPLDPDKYGNKMDYTFRYCPFCGSETDGLAEPTHDETT